MLVTQLTKLRHCAFKCINTDGSFDCDCPTGYIGDPWIECEDYDNCVDEVLCGYNEICVNEVGTYRCDCKAGWHQVRDKSSGLSLIQNVGV